MGMIMRRLTPAAAICGLALALAACGGSSSSGGGGGGTGSSGSTLKPALTGAGENLTNGVKGGTLTVYQHEDFQHLDPGEAYFSLDYEIIYPTNRPLYQFSPDSTTKVVPDLASGPPVVSDGGKTITVRIRSGVKFSPPVNRAVTSADVAYGIERGANPNVANPYFPAYFVGILKGADKANGRPDLGNLDAEQVHDRLPPREPDATFFLGVLSLPTTAPIPKEFAGPLDKQKPTTYGTKFLVSSGPYMFKSDSKGNIQGTGYQPGKSATLVRNPNWDPKTDFRPAYLNQININIGGDPNVIGRQTLTGSHAVQNDTPVGPGREAGLPEVLQPAHRGSGRRRLLHRAGQRQGTVRERERAQGAVGGARPRGDGQGRGWRHRRSGGDPLPLPGVRRVRRWWR